MGTIPNMDWIDQATCEIVLRHGDERLIIRADQLKHQLIEQFEEPQPEPTPDPEPMSPEEYWRDAITVYGQRDPRWSGHNYHGSYTIGGAGCYICSFCMLLDYYYGEEIITTPHVVSEILNLHQVFWNGLFTGVERAAEQYGLEWIRRNDWVTQPLSINDLQYVQHELEEGPVIMAVDFYPKTTQWETHFVLALEYSSEFDDILIADPWEDEITWLRQSRFGRDSWTLGRAIYGLRIFRKQEDA